MKSGEHPGEGIFHGHDKTFHVATLVVLGMTTSRDLHSVLGHLRLLSGEKVGAGIIWPVWKSPETDAGDENRDNTLDEEKPLPGVQVGNALHVLENASSEEARDDVRDNVTGMPDTHSERGFLLSVPRGSEKRDTWYKWTLGMLAMGVITWEIWLDLLL